MPRERKGGKPPIHKSDPDVIKRLVEALKAGNYIDHACAYAGISRTAYYDWLRRGQEERERIEMGEVPRASEAGFLEIVQQVEEARALAVVRNVQVIQNAAKAGTWQAAAWWLERTLPGQYGRRVATELSGPGGGPVDVAVDVLTPEALDARIAELIGEITEGG